MHPILFKLGPLTIYTYGFMMATAFITCYYILIYEFKRLQAPPDFASNVVFWAAIGGIVGAKILYLVENLAYVIDDPIGMIFSGAGLVFHGGLIGGSLAVIALIKYHHLPLRTYGDRIGPVLLIGQGIGRIGCFFAGCCHGKMCDLPWAMTFPHASPSAPYPVHPTQLYETLINFVLFFLLVKVIRPRLKIRGVTLAIYLILAGCERFLLEFLRVNPKVALGLSSAQYTSLVMIGLGIGLMVLFFRMDSAEIKPS